MKYRVVIFIGLILFILPFFWLKPGTMDLGGDETRLFFYDPINYLKSFAIYDVSLIGRGELLASYYNIPFVALIALLKFFIHSPTILIDIINGLKLSGAFIFTYLLVFSFIRETDIKSDWSLVHKSSIIAALFYVSSLISYNMVFDWETPMDAHNQIFLYPFIAYLLFKFLVKKDFLYMTAALLLSFVFSVNFAWLTAPQVLAFYPMVIIFLLLYVSKSLKREIAWGKLFLGFILFFGIQSFQLLGQVVNLFAGGNLIHERAFNLRLAYQLGVNYFIAVSPHGKALLNLFLPSANMIFGILSIVTPAVIILGFIFNKRKEMYMIFIFFAITFFFATANITQVGYEIYKLLFYIPAFSVFRVFYIKWMIVFLFFYTLLFGFCLFEILKNLKKNYANIVFEFLFTIYLVISLPLLVGLPVRNSIIRGSENVPSAFKMDPKYEQTLAFIRKLPQDGKIMTLPLTDFYLQVVPGKDGGAYVGYSTISMLTEHYSFSGYQDFGFSIYDPQPYAGQIMQHAKEKNYNGLLHIFNTLNIRYILYDEDPRAYDHIFAYSYVRGFLPKTQREYIDFIHHFPVHEIYKNGTYHIYEFDNSVFNPIIFVPDSIYQSKELSLDKDKIHSAYVSSCNETNICNYGKSGAQVHFTVINPTEYKVTIDNNKHAQKIVLVMQNMFDKGWNISTIPNRHIVINGYANAWVLDNLENKKELTVFIRLDQQKYFLYGWIITVVSLIITLGVFIISIVL